MVGDRSGQGAETLGREGRRPDEEGRALPLDGASQARHVMINEKCVDEGDRDWIGEGSHQKLPSEISVTQEWFGDDACGGGVEIFEKQYEVINVSYCFK